jgi:hypothetical protein
MLFLSPSDYFNFKLVDEMDRSEMQALQKASFATATISIESLDSPLPKIYPAVAQNIDVIYREWMLTPTDYRSLIESIEHIGAKPYTSLPTYLATHYLPNWDRLLADFTLKLGFIALMTISIHGIGLIH